MSTDASQCVHVRVIWACMSAFVTFNQPSKCLFLTLMATMMVASLAGPLPLRRLAARFIPRFASRCPQLLDQAVQSLICLADPESLHETSLSNGADLLAEGCLQDALRGFGSLCSTASPSRASADGGGVSPEPRTKALHLAFQHLLRCAHAFVMQDSSSAEGDVSPPFFFWGGGKTQGCKRTGLEELRGRHDEGGSLHGSPARGVGLPGGEKPCELQIDLQRALLAPFA